MASVTSVSRISAEQAPKGSITVDRIADIKYPTEQQRSPDGKTVAFLWDAAGKQDLFMVRASGQPVALTDFPLNPDIILISDIAHFEWAASDEIILSKDNQLWSVRRPLQNRRLCRVFRGRQFLSLCGQTDHRVCADGDIWVASLKGKTRCRLTHMSEGFHVSGLSFSPDGKYVAFDVARHEQFAEPLPYNGNLVKVFRS